MTLPPNLSELGWRFLCVAAIEAANAQKRRKSSSGAFGMEALLPSPPSSRPDSWKFRRKQQTLKIPHVKIKTHKFGAIIECADAFCRLLRSEGGALDLCQLILLTLRMICKRRTSYLTKCSQILTQSLLETLAFGFFLSFFLTTRKIYFIYFHPPLSQCPKWFIKTRTSSKKLHCSKTWSSF